MFLIRQLLIIIAFFVNTATRIDFFFTLSTILKLLELYLHCSDSQNMTSCVNDGSTPYLNFAREDRGSSYVEIRTPKKTIHFRLRTIAFGVHSLRAGFRINHEQVLYNGRASLLSSTWNTACVPEDPRSITSTTGQRKQFTASRIQPYSGSASQTQD